MTFFEWLATHKYLEIALVSVGLVLDGILGAWISTKIRAQSFIVWTALLSGNLSLFVWMYLARFSKMTLPVASVLFDIVYNISWIFALVYFGTKVTSTQMIGILLTILGVAFMSYHTPVP